MDERIKVFDPTSLICTPPRLVIPEIHAAGGKNPFIKLSEYYLREIMEETGIRTRNFELIMEKLTAIAQPMGIQEHQLALDRFSGNDGITNGLSLGSYLFRATLYAMGVKIESPLFRTGQLITTELFDPETKIRPLNLCVAISRFRYALLGTTQCFTIGKYRGGVHHEHLKTFRAAKQVVGTRGIFTVLVESKDSIQARLGTGLGVLDDEKRLAQVAESPFVDNVALVGIATAEQEEINDYYEAVWRQFFPGVYMLGARSDSMFGLFADRSNKTGVLLRWVREQNSESTTSNVALLSGA